MENIIFCHPDFSGNISVPHFGDLIIGMSNEQALPTIGFYRSVLNANEWSAVRKIKNGLTFALTVKGSVTPTVEQIRIWEWVNDNINEKINIALKVIDPLDAVEQLDDFPVDKLVLSELEIDTEMKVKMHFSCDVCQKIGVYPTVYWKDKIPDFCDWES